MLQLPYAIHNRYCLAIFDVDNAKSWRRNSLGILDPVAKLNFEDTDVTKMQCLEKAKGIIDPHVLYAIIPIFCILAVHMFYYTAIFRNNAFRLHMHQMLNIECK